jgi:hypothetical protein
MLSKILGSLVVIVGASAIGLATAPQPVHAATADADHVFFVGTTTSLTPPVQPVGGGGSYTFSSTASPGACAINSADSDAGSPTGDVEAGGACTITSSGTYTNTVCGTGTATGTATLSESGSDTYTITYTITFAAGQGVLSGTATESGDASETAPIAGNVTIIPTGGTCATGVTQFTVVGSAVSTV